MNNKNILFCNNCGKIGHSYKKCFEPIISCGIICIKIDNVDLYNFLYNKYKNNDKENRIIYVYKYIQKNINNNNKNYLEYYTSKIDDEVKYLLVRRKFTYNYIYLIRGIYVLEIENIINSINSLTHQEYNNLINLSFEDLWKDIWGDNIFKNELLSNYYKAKDQFIFLKNYILPQIQHRIKINLNEPSWGFPKGKRNENESNLECAIREFEEETGLNEDNYTILDSIYPMNEEINGSNNINYKYIYYVALLKNNYNDNELLLNKNSNQYFEIGKIGLFNNKLINHILNNTEKINLIHNLNLFLIYNARYYERYYLLK